MPLSNSNNPMTPSAQHGEPWTIQEHDSGDITCVNSDAVIVFNTAARESHIIPLTRRNSRRAVDCVNALRSVANPAAVPGLLKVIQSVSEIAEGYRSDNDMDRILKAFDATLYQERTAEG